MGEVVQEYVCCSQWSLQAQVFQLELFLSALIVRISLADNDNNEIANQTLFIRRIALRSDTHFYKRKWGTTSVPHTFMQRFRATLLGTSDDWK